MVTIDEVKNFYSQIQADYKEAIKMESRVDILESQILHYIEVGSYNAAQGSILLKKLKDVRKERRIIKNRVSELQSIVDNLSKANIEKMHCGKSNLYAIALDDILNAKIA